MITTEIESRHSREAIEEEIQIFEERLQQLRRGQITEDQLRPFRLKHGIYGQRQPGFQMVRVKVPSGIINPEQLRVLADIAASYSTDRGHVTTRENVQFHFVKMQNVPTIMRLLADAGLTTREACGNEVRNVTSCPLAGICPTEAFDVTPYALATTRYFLRHPEFHDLPRKFKIAFSGCEDDGNCAVAGIHDIGLIAQIRGSNGTAHRGFRVLVGGGLGSLPTEAAVLTEFLAEEELIPTMEAILGVFAEHGNRQNKYKARMKFVLRDKGIAEFRRLVAGKRAQAEAPTEPLNIASLVQPSPVRPPLVNIAPALASDGLYSHGNGHSEDFAVWHTHNVQPQRQPGYAMVWLKLLAGTVTASQFRGTAALLERHHLSATRIAISQDLVVPWVPVHLVCEIHKELKALDLATPGARTIADVTGCPGATTCNLGITRSHTLSEVLAAEFAQETDPLVEKIRIKISGCPNSCGQHHLADIGLYGNARRVAGRQAPYYQLLLGGRVDQQGVRFGRQVVPVPAKRIVEALRALINAYKAGRSPLESFGSWADRTSEEEILQLLQPFLEASTSDADLFVDWGDAETYSLKLGRGECAA